MTLRTSKTIAGLLVAATVLTACEGVGPKQTAGTLLGGAGGALIGSQFGGGRGRLVGTAIGTLAGAFLGGYIGKSMDDQDRQMAAATQVQALETAPDGRASAWHNPNNGHRGNVVVTRTQEFPRSHEVCRDYVHTVIIDGRQEKVHGRACRDVRDPRAMWVARDAA